MVSFMKQIKEDIIDYQDRFPNIPNIHKPEWAFNFWILDKLYSQDEQLIEEKIVDYKDKGIDCWVWHEDQKDLYLIQNKYFDENTSISKDYIQNDFLVRAIGALENGTYTRSPELQTIFTRYSVDSDFSVHFRLYVTNDIAITEAIRDILKSYNQDHSNYDAEAYSLKEIETKYYGEPINEKKSLSFEIETVNGGTVLNVNTKDYKLAQNIDAKYVFTPIRNLYELLKYAHEEKYPIFDTNIREYLGSTGTVNKGIATTLKDKKDRKNFFYYNNGVTMIVKKIDPVKTQGSHATLKIYNPHIVNGCQTVSTIYEVLNGYPEMEIENDFKDCYIMLKVLQISEESEEMQILNDSIVKYNNSQNAINPKTFAANASEFRRIKTEFERKGFLMCIKQSDKHTYDNKYKTITELLNKNANLIQQFGLKDMKMTKNFYIDIEKFLQVLLAFKNGALDAIRNKSKLLVPGSNQNEAVVNLIKSPDVSINDLLCLYLLYLRAEQEKKDSESGKIPIPFYLITCFAHYDCGDRIDKISSVLDNSEKINRIIILYKKVSAAYYAEWTEENSGKDYNDMIKSPINMNLLDKQVRVQKTVL